MHHQSITLGPDGSSVSPDITDTVLASLDAGKLGRVDALTGRATRPQRSEDGAGGSGFAASRPTLADYFESRAARYADWRESTADSAPGPWRYAACSRLGRRAAGYEAGLSNAAYLAVSSGTRKIRAEFRASGVKFSLFDPIHELTSGCPPVTGGGVRGQISELSDESKRRMGARAAALQARGYKPELFLTLTSPANWEQVYLQSPGESGGRIFKAHMFAFKRRLTRFLAKIGLSNWSGFWFLEFQKRGAPHLHLYLFNCSVSMAQHQSLIRWCGPAWADIIGNPDPVEHAKHVRAGTSVERAKAKHFGYAAKYSSKASQKEVPEGFRDVGRFWGCWNYDPEQPVIIDYDFNLNNPSEVALMGNAAWAALSTLLEKSPDFSFSTYEDFYAFITGQRIRAAFTLFGNSASTAWLQALDCPPLDWSMT